MRKENVFIILTRSRTGSNFLKTLLNSHSSVSAHGEIFGRFPENLDVASFVRNKMDSTDKPVLGFKFFYYHPIGCEKSGEDFLKSIESHFDVSYIHLKRKDVYQTVVSRAVAGKTGAWSSRSESEWGESLELGLVFENVKNEIMKTRRWWAQFDSFLESRRSLELCYEDLAISADSEIQKICKFLGIPFEALATDLKQQGGKRVNIITGLTEEEEDILRTI